MIAAGTAIDDRRRGSRISLFVGIGAAHLFAIWLLLQPWATGEVAGSQPVLSLFDIAPPLPPDPPAPLPPPRIAGKAGGGSPGVRRQRAAVMVETPVPPAREAMDATPAPLPVQAPPATAAGTAPVDLGDGGLNGVGMGSGAGVGSGDGRGRGTGTGNADADDDVYGRAEWLERPPTDLWRQSWPRGRERLAQSVRVRVACKVRRNGRPYSCRVKSESPSRLGFGETALAVLRESRVKPVSRNGESLWDLPVLISIVFDAIETAPLIGANAAASAPPAR